MEQESQLISGPQKFSISGSSSIPWKWLRFLNIIHGSFQTSSKKFHVDGESSDSEKNVDEKSRVPLNVIPKAQMAKKKLKTPNNNGVQKSTWVKYLV